MDDKQRRVAELVGLIEVSRLTIAGHKRNLKIAESLILQCTGRLAAEEATLERLMKEIKALGFHDSGHAKGEMKKWTS